MFLQQTQPDKLPYMECVSAAVINKWIPSYKATDINTSQWFAKGKRQDWPFILYLWYDAHNNVMQ